MARTYIQTCDRCGKQINGMYHTLIYYPLITKRELELCHDCHTELKKFIEDGKKKESNNE